MLPEEASPAASPARGGALTIPGAVVNSDGQMLVHAAGKVAELMQNNQVLKSNNDATKRREVARSLARTDLNQDVLEWTEGDVFTWASALGCDTAAEALRAHGVNGECLLEIGPDVFRAVGVKTVGWGKGEATGGGGERTSALHTQLHRPVETSMSVKVWLCEN